MSEIKLKLTIDGKEGIATLILTDKELQKIISGITKAREESRTTGDQFVTSFNRLRVSIEGVEAAYRVFQTTLAKPIQLYADLEQANISFEVMIGNAERAQKLISDLREFGAKTPLEFTGLQKNAQLLLSFGIEADRILPFLKMIGDVSGGSADRMNSLTLAFAQMNSAGRLMGQDLMQMINAGFNPLQTMSEKTGKSMAVLKKEMESGAISSQMVVDAFKDATSEGGRFYQMLEKSAESTAGKISNFNDNITMLQTNTGELIVEALNPLLDSLNRFFTTLNDIDPLLSGTIGTIGITGTALIGLNATGLLPLIMNFRGLGNSLLYATGYMKLAAAEGMAVKGSMTAAGIATKGFFASLGPVGWAILGITALATAFELLHTNTEKAKGNAESYMQTITKGIEHYNEKRTTAEKKFTKDYLVELETQIKEKEKAYDDSFKIKRTKDKEDNEYVTKIKTEQTKILEVELNTLKEQKIANEQKVQLLDEQLERLKQIKSNMGGDGKATGLLGGIDAEINKLNELRPLAKTVEDISYIDNRMNQLVNKKKEIEFASKNFGRDLNIGDVKPKGGDTFKFEKMEADEVEKIRISMIDNEFDRQRAMAEFEYNQQKEKFGNLIVLRLEHDKKIRDIETERSNYEKQLADNEALTKMESTKMALTYIAGAFSQHTLFGKASAAILAGINTKEAATKALTAGPILGPILAGIILAAGMKQVADILSAEPPKAPGYFYGGRLPKGQRGYIEGEHNEIIAPEQTFIEIMRNELIPRLIVSSAVGSAIQRGVNHSPGNESLAGLFQMQFDKMNEWQEKLMVINRMDDLDTNLSLYKKFKTEYKF